MPYSTVTVQLLGLTTIYQHRFFSHEFNLFHGSLLIYSYSFLHSFWYIITTHNDLLKTFLMINQASSHLINFIVDEWIEWLETTSSRIVQKYQFYSTVFAKCVAFDIPFLSRFFMWLLILEHMILMLIIVYHVKSLHYYFHFGNLFSHQRDSTSVKIEINLYTHT